MKKALITGVTGQDGSYLAELLLEKGYEVHGMCRRSSSEQRERIDHIKHPSFFLHYGDMTDSSVLTRLIATIVPDEVYNLAAQSHVGVSFETPEYTANADGIGTLRILEAIKTLKLTTTTRFYQASTSELYGNSPAPQSETTPFYPRSPYAAAKLYAYWITVNYREAYGMYACNGILFNHESPRRGLTFVTRKITQSVARIAYGLQEKVSLGNLDARRDWGHAAEYVEAMWLMLQQDHAEDFVIATGKTHSVREFIIAAFEAVGIPLEWVGSGVHEKGINRVTGAVVVDINPHYFRPTEVELLLGDATKAYQKLGWKPKTTFKELVSLMVQADYKSITDEAGLMRLPAVQAGAKRLVV